MPAAVDGNLQSAIDTLQSRIAADPDIQRILTQNHDRIVATHDKGGDARSFQNNLRDQITALAKSRGYMPAQGNYFINPNDGQLEPHRGWSGLSGWQKAAIIAAAAATGVGAGVALGGLGAAAAGAGGGAAAGGGSGAGIGVGVTSGLGATLPGSAIALPSAAGIGGATATGAGIGTAALHGAELGAANGAVRGGVSGGWKGALSGGAMGGLTGAATGGLTSGLSGAVGAGTTGASKMGWSDIVLGSLGAKNPDGSINWANLTKSGLNTIGALEQGRQGQREADTASTITRDTQGINALAQNNNARATAAQIEMQQKQDERDALNTAYKNALRSSLALNMSDTHFARPEGVPDFSVSGGPRPSALGAQGKEAASLMNAKAIEALMNPEKLTALPMPEPYSLSDLPKTSALDNVLGAAGAAGKVLEANQARTDASKQSDLIAELLAASRQQAATPMQTGLTGAAPSANVGNWARALQF